MANKPVLGIATCPYCKAGNPVIWNGNFKYPCMVCNKTFRVKRQKLANVQPLKAKKSDKK